MVIFVLTIIIGHIITYYIGFHLISSVKEKYKWVISSLMIVYGILYVPLIQYYFNWEADNKWVRGTLIVSSYLLSLLLFLIVKKIFLKRRF